MDNGINAIWESILSVRQELQKTYPNVPLDLTADADIIFKREFTRYYNFILENFMQKNEQKENNNDAEHPVTLDRHKVAAVIICSILKADIIKNPNNEDNSKAFLGNEIIAFNAAFSYMYSALKSDFEKGLVPYDKLFEHYIMPKPYSCNRSFDYSLCRDLYYTKTNYELSPISLSNLLFVLEDYSFIQNGIKRKE